MLVIGMHRSGTTLLTRMLMVNGIDMGTRLSVNAEDVFWRDLNERIMRHSGASWCTVQPLLRALNREGFVCGESQGVSADVARWIVRRSRSSVGDTTLWGWKDPRTTLTLPIWLRVFPRARLVYIVRNGIDVAISLHRRAVKNNCWWKRILPRYKWNRRMLDFAACFRLWEEYVGFAFECLSTIPPERCIQIRYEELIARPKQTLWTLLNFLGKKAGDSATESASLLVNTDRLDNTSLMSQYRSEIHRVLPSALMVKLGYDANVSQ